MRLGHQDRILDHTAHRGNEWLLNRSSHMDKKHVTLLLVATCIVIGLWVATPFAVRWRFPDSTRQGTFGDLYGSVNALFSGLALLGVVAAILLQQKELSLSTKELKNSATALQKQVELSAYASRIQVLPGLIQLQKVRLKTLDIDGFKNFEQWDYSSKELQSLLDLQKKAIGLTLESCDRLKDELRKPMDTVVLEHKKSELAQKQAQAAKWQQIGPEIALLIQYQDDLVKIYEKISSPLTTPASSHEGIASLS